MRALRRNAVAACAVAAVALTAAVAGCGGGGDGGTTPPPPVDHLVLSPANPAAMTAFNQTTTLTAQPLDQSDNPVPNAHVTWSTSAQGVIDLTATSGLTTKALAKSNGPATITATAGGKSTSLQMSVAQQYASLALNKSTTTIVLNGTDQLSATLADGGGSALQFAGLPAPTFASDDSTIADVSAAGLVTAKKVGTTKVTASATFGGATKSAQATVVVTNQPVSQTFQVTSTNSDSWDPPTVTIHSGDKVEFTVTGLHNLLFDAGNPAPMANLGSGSTPIGTTQVTTHTFTTVGTYNYRCGVHAGMTGQVVVTP